MFQLNLGCSIRVYQCVFDTFTYTGFNSHVAVALLLSQKIRLQQNYSHSRPEKYQIAASAIKYANNINFWL